jgi:hypothetical protein
MKVYDLIDWNIETDFAKVHIALYLTDFKNYYRSEFMSNEGILELFSNQTLTFYFFYKNISKYLSKVCY